MPYNPGVQDISGQLLASGMLNAAQTRGQMYGDIGQFMSNMGTSFLKQEEERQKSASAIKGFLNDPYYQQQIAENPELTAEMGKIQSGKAKLSDVRGFLGTLSTMQHMREETMKADQMEAQRQYNQALREQSLANVAATQAATDERKRQNQISNEFLKTTKEVDDLENIINGGGTLTSQQSDRLEQLRDNPFVTSARQGIKAGLDPMTAIRLGQSQEALDAKGMYQDAMAQLRQQQLENQRVMEEAKRASQPRLAAGSERTFSIGDKQIKAEWDGKDWVDTKTGAPVYVSREVRDPAGNVVIERGAPNPFVFKSYGIPVESPISRTPGMPGAQPAPENMEEVAAPMPEFTPGEKPAAKTLAIFDNEQQARQALERGEIMPGQTVTIGGRRVMLRAKTK